MSLDLWSQILACCRREGHFVDWAHFFGEPLAWEHFFAGMRLWRDSGLSVDGRISTNGHLLTDERIDCIVETKVKCVRICVDTLYPAVYERLRNNSNLDGLLIKVEKFLKKAPDVPCQIQFLRSRENTNENPKDFFKCFRGHKNLSVFVSDCQDIGGDSLLSICKNLNPDPRQCTKVGYEHCVITWDGQIGLCCIDYALRNRLGNMSEGSIEGAYLGEYAEKVRAQIRQGQYELAPYCRQCPMDHVGYQCYEIFYNGEDV
jgi:MoaA/NifB/PqqE/SkfB family radical SAM enzyme